MKNLFLLTATTLLVSTQGYAQHGGPKKIVCREDGAVILEVTEAQGNGQFANSYMELSVTGVGGDIRSVTLTDRRSGDRVVANRSDEILNAELFTDESSAPVKGSSFTQKGLAKLSLSGLSGDKVDVTSYERKSESKMDIILTSDENAADPLTINCVKEQQ